MKHHLKSILENGDFSFKPKTVLFKKIFKLSTFQGKIRKRKKTKRIDPFLIKWMTNNKDIMKKPTMTIKRKMREEMLKKEIFCDLPTD